MFIFLSKLLPPFIYPLGLGCILVLIGLFLRRRVRLQRTALVLAVVILWGGSTRYAAYILARPLEWRYLPAAEVIGHQPGLPPVAPILVVLGGGTGSAEAPRPFVEEYNSRVVYAAYLYRQGVSQILLLTGGRIDFLGGSGSGADQMQALLELMGVPSGSLWLEPNSRNTYENAAFSRQLIESKTLPEGENKLRIVLVTSAMHMPRSVALFQRQGFEVIPAPTDFKVTQLGWSELWRPNPAALVINLLPSSSNLDTTSDALKEYLGLLVYWLRGWV